MKYEKQHRLTAELNAMYPRGTLDQNVFRDAYFDSRMHGRSPEESEAVAIAVVRKSTPGFVPDRRGF